VAEDRDRCLTLVNAIMNLLQRRSYRADITHFMKPATCTSRYIYRTLTTTTRFGDDCHRQTATPI